MPRDIGKVVFRDVPTPVTGIAGATPVPTVDVDPGVLWDEKAFTWTNGKPTQILYKLSSVTVATKTLTWSGDELTGITVVTA